MSGRGSTRRRAVVTSAALVLGGLIAGVVLTEVAHRIARRWVCVGRPPNYIYEPRAEYGWGHRANARGWMYACVGRRYEWRREVRVNAHGLLGEDRPYAKPPGVRRVLLLGDSMTEALQVPVAQTFATRLETSLRRGGATTEVLNGGVAAFGTDNELLYFRDEGVLYGSDLVLLVFNLANDVSENSPTLNVKMYGGSPVHIRSKTYFRLDEGRLVPVPPARLPTGSVSWWSQVESRLYVVRAIRRLLTPPARMEPNFMFFGVMRRTPDPEWAEAWAVTEALVRRLRDDVEATGARFAVAIMPNREIVSPAIWQMIAAATPDVAAQYDPEAPVRRMAAFLAREQIPFLDLLPALRAGADTTGDPGFFAVDIHLAPTGHARVAEALGPFVAGLLAKPDDARH